jgi:hypothetical protein
VPATHDKTGRARKRSGSILAAPPRSTTRQHGSKKVPGQFAWHLIEMLESPAFRAMSLTGHRIRARIEIELGHHGGHDNGKLPVTFENFTRYGIDRQAIAPAIREVVALGFVEVTEHGRAGNAEFRTPNKFRLTYRPTDDRGPTDEWRNVKSIEAANAIAKAARTSRRPTNGSTKKQNPVGENNIFSGGNPHRKPGAPSGENPHYSHGGENHPTIDISPLLPLST